MVVGESGLGKSTLVNSMFMTDIYSSKETEVSPSMAKTVQVETHSVVLQEGGVKLSLNVVDTPGITHPWDYGLKILYPLSISLVCSLKLKQCL